MAKKVAGAILTITSALFSQMVCSCECDTQSVAQGLATSEAVFLARVDSAAVRVEGEDSWIVVGISEVVVKKGNAEGWSSVRTPARAGSCGMKITVPDYYWFFTNAAGEFTRCGATRLWTDEDARPLTQSVMDKLVEKKREAARRLESE